MLTLIPCPFHPRVTEVARKRPRSFCRKCRWQVTPKHAYTLDPTKSEWADCATVQAQCGKPSGNKLTLNLSGNIRPKSSQLAEPLWTDPGRKSEISVHEPSICPQSCSYVSVQCLNCDCQPRCVIFFKCWEKKSPQGCVTC